jgi:hypothetical protein
MNNQESPRSYWLRIEPETGNPWRPAEACWAYYEVDKPIWGVWIKVTEERPPND